MRPGRLAAHSRRDMHGRTRTSPLRRYSACFALADSNVSPAVRVVPIAIRHQQSPRTNRWSAAPIGRRALLLPRRRRSADHRSVRAAERVERRGPAPLRRAGPPQPARIDRVTSYRSYRLDQLVIARTIARMRDLEVPLDTIRELLASRRAGGPPAAPGGPWLADRGPYLSAPARPAHPRPTQFGGPRRHDHDARPDGDRPDHSPDTRRRPVQPRLDPAREDGPDARPGRRDAARRPCLAISLG